VKTGLGTFRRFGLAVIAASALALMGFILIDKAPPASADGPYGPYGPQTQQCLQWDYQWQAQWRVVGQRWQWWYGQWRLRPVYRVVHIQVPVCVLHAPQVFYQPQPCLPFWAQYYNYNQCQTPNFLNYRVNYQGYWP
jgi:hypothetical protein